jgi:hypothetical protein
MEQSPRTARLMEWPIVGIGVLMVLCFAMILRLEGREWLSDSGFGFWTGAWTPNTSQWLADPYSTSHVLHGVFFYWFLLPFRRWFSAGQRLLLAILIEGGWELLENSPSVIERYRTATASLEYFGDSVMNSAVDILCAAVGFWLAWRFDWKWMVVLIVAVELLMLYFVRDNLTLNILMLLYPFESIKAWQAAMASVG